MFEGTIWETLPIWLKAYCLLVILIGLSTAFHIFYTTTIQSLGG